MVKQSVKKNFKLLFFNCFSKMKCGNGYKHITLNIIINIVC